MEKLAGSPRQWLERFLRDEHISGTDRAAHALRCPCDVLEEAVCLDQLNLGALACLEVVARRLNLSVKQGGAPWTPLGESDEILAPGLRAHIFRRAREDWEVVQSRRGCGGFHRARWRWKRREGGRVEVPARDKAKEAEVPALLPPRPWRN